MFGLLFLGGCFRSFYEGVFFGGVTGSFGLVFVVCFGGFTLFLGVFLES